jgi:hypothetical protein
MASYVEGSAGMVDCLRAIVTTKEHLAGSIADGSD